ncbi:MAG: hypothetical protein IRZ08_15165 [Frankia sp.]|nr:hypothetical protein [Frankia sp.]
MWPAEVVVSGRPIRYAQDRVRPHGVADPVPFVVHSPDGPIAGLIDQPFQRGGLSRLSRRHSRLRIRAAGRTWVLAASTVMPGMARVIRLADGADGADDGDPLVVLTPRGVRSSLVGPGADQLDLTIALLTISAIQESAYNPVLGRP